MYLCAFGHDTCTMYNNSNWLKYEYIRNLDTIACTLKVSISIVTIKKSEIVHENSNVIITNPP